MTRRRRRRTFKEWSNSPRFAGSFFAVMAAVCAFFAVVTHGDAVALRDNGVVVEAEVLEVHDGRNSYVVVEFETRQGQQVVAEVGAFSWRPEPHVGDRQTVIYDPEQPDGNVADTRLGPDFFAVWLLGIGAAAAALLVWPSFSGRIDWNDWAR